MHDLTDLVLKIYALFSVSTSRRKDLIEFVVYARVRMVKVS